ncbi:hypothetical protein [Thermomonospora cellulosilytica]|uniref:Uncharacterized protein n=1 Tax=Thermomonospora cellulosilytica TaxID=1411118 RepID=A0A7W3MW44_9ACTN|nr:hypothetical protein [Thermomonospora cellulosilytica]MBA9002961.1 hypothetical protein [Thermomonospora cellulosilytica]
MLWLHTAFLAFGTFALFTEASAMREHGSPDAGALLIGGVMGVGLTCGLALSAVQVMRAVPWARYLTLALESFFLFGALVQFAVLLTAPDLVGGAVAIAHITVIGTVIWLVGKSREWFGSSGAQNG